MISSVFAVSLGLWVVFLSLCFIRKSATFCNQMAVYKKSITHTGRFTISSFQHAQSLVSYYEDHSKSVPRHLFSQKHRHEPELFRSEKRRDAKQTEENERSSENEAKYESFQSLANKYKVDSPLLVTSAPKSQDKTTMTEHPKDIRAGHVQGAYTELGLCFALQKTLSAKFSEMLILHKEIMLELMSKERSRDEQMRRLTQILNQQRVTNAKLWTENRQICDILAKHRE